ncbi:MAG TPA: hypothetical protein VEG40_09230 [Gaiellaceae bacterium]|nr:hypothetical protein [Gaiellaceae bacterium]
METLPELSDWPVLEAGMEDGKVRRWREEQFRALGFSAAQATELAFSRADLGQARFLRGAGCEPKLALRILR